MSNPNLTVDEICSAIDHLNTDEFQQLNQALDQKRRDRLKKIVQKARQNTGTIDANEAEDIIRKSIAEVRTENAAYGRS